MEIETIVLISGYLIAYAALHSLLAALPIKAAAVRVFGAVAARGYRLTYNIVATVLLLPLAAILFVLPDTVLYTVPDPWAWLLRGGQLLALLGLAVTVLQTDVLHFVGVRQLLQDRPTTESPLVIRGVYRYVRHPMYFFSLLLMWLTPDMTVGLLTVFVWFSLYFWLGSIHEEHRLLREFGDSYRLYQQKTPRLLPLPPLPPRATPVAQRKEESS